MSNLLSEIRRLKKQLKLADTSNLKTVPDRWEDFARLTRIRSGAGFVSFEPYGYQVKLSDTIDSHPTTVIVKTRQLGISETIISKFVHKALKSNGYLAVVFSRNQQDTANLAKRCRGMIESIPEYAKLTTDSLQALRFSNGSGILFRNATPNGARGIESVSDILYDEAEFVDEIEEIYKSSIPCTAMLGNDARIIINSTPGKRSGWYFDKLNSNNGNKDVIKLAEDIRSGKSGNLYWTDTKGWGKVILHWSEHPKYSLVSDYLESVRDRFQLDESTVQQEFNLSFSDSAEMIFSPAIVRRACVGSLTKVRNPKADYYLGVDPNASSTGKDYFVITILEHLDNKLRLVELYRKRGETSESHLFNLGNLINKYKPVTTSIETNNSGNVYIEQLQLDKPEIDVTPVKTTASSKPGMISRLVMSMEDETLTLSDQQIITTELLSFQRSGNKMEAIKGKTDDIVMSLAIGIVGSPYTGRKTLTFKVT